MNAFDAYVTILPEQIQNKCIRFQLLEHMYTKVP